MATTVSFYWNYQGIKQIQQHARVTKNNPSFIRIADYLPNTIWSHFGLYQGDKVFITLKPQYQQMIQTQYLPQLTAVTLEKVQHALTNHSTTIFSTYKYYQMLQQPAHFDAQAIYQSLSDADKQQFNLSQLKMALTYMQQVGFTPLAENQQIATAVSHITPNVDDAARKLLATLETDSQNSYPFKSMTIIDNGDNLAIPTLYTAAGYTNYLNFKAKVLADSKKAFWFYPVKAEQLTAALNIALDTQYRTNYIQHWHNLLNQLNFTGMASLTEEAQTLQQITTKDILQLLTTINQYGFILYSSDNTSAQINKLFLPVKNSYIQQTTIDSITQQLNKLATQLQALVANPANLIAFMQQAERDGGIAELNLLRQDE
jgi:type VI protein secretion system component VasK